MKKTDIDGIGLVGVVVCKPTLGDITSVMILNDVGGSSFLPLGRYAVKVVHGFDDYETGRHLHGVLLDKKDIEVARKTGTTGLASRRPTKDFDPKKVYFKAKDFVEAPRRKQFRWPCPMCAAVVRDPAKIDMLADGIKVCSECLERSHGRKTMNFHTFQRLCFANSKKIPIVEIGGRRKEWVGFGVIDIGPATGTEVLITP